MSKKKGKEEQTLDEKLKIAIIPKEEEPYKVPDNWVWTRLGKLVNVLNGDRGKNYPSKDKLFDKGEIPFISAVNLEEGKILTDKLLYLSEEQYDKLRAGKLQEKDLLFCLRGSLGKFGKNYFDKGAIASSLVILRDKTVGKFLNSYVEKYLFSPLLSAEILKYNNGTAQPNLSAENLKKFLVPLPPIDEQKRIVNKLDYFFDKIQKVKEIIEEVKEKNEARKESILSKAFTGELTAKWRADNIHSAKELLNKINDEKLSNWEQECQKAEGRKKPTKPKLKSIDEMIVPNDEIPYEIPNNWVWTIMNTIVDVRDGTHDSPIYYSEGYPLVTSKNLKNNEINFEDVKFISKEDMEKINQRSRVEIGDVLYAMIGTIGNPVYCDFDSLNKFAVKNVAIFKPFIKEFGKYLKYYLESKSYEKLIETKVKGTTQKFVPLNILRNVYLPLPPIEEQKEIVRILDNIFTKENLINELISLEDKIQALEKSILSKAFRGELGTNSSDDIEAMELLKEILQK